MSGLSGEAQLLIHTEGGISTYQIRGAGSFFSEYFGAVEGCGGLLRYISSEEIFFNEYAER